MANDAAPTGSWKATCTSEPTSQATALFQIPRASDPPGNTDFYRLPFPNDIRKRGGRISMKGHPRPGSRLVAFDLVERFLEVIEADATGFGTNQAVYLRFSRDPDFATLERDVAFTLIDITPGSPEYGHARSPEWMASTGRTAYLCNRYLMIRPAFGQPLRPGTTYAAIMRTTVRDTEGHPFGKDADFVAMLADVSPGDADLAAAWTAYAPLRRYLGDATAPLRLTADELAVAAVFTTEAVEQPLHAIHTAIAAAPLPAVSALVRCGDVGAVSPCDDGKIGFEHNGGCPAAGLSGASFDEYQGTITLPVFQQGTAPYAQPKDGGGIALDSNGQVAVVRQEPVCFSLTVPKGTAPAGGWPLVVYSHGTGGTYRSAIDLGLAEDYARGEATGGAAVPMATLGYEGVLHGSRKGASTAFSEELVYNVYNPRAARDNGLQAVADLLALPRALSHLGGIKIDPDHVALYGHSQGGNAASLAAARDAGYGTVVLSGTGGTLLLSLIGKTKPVNLLPLLAMLLGDPVVDKNHPVLNLVQMVYERSDSVNFAGRLFREPAAGARRRHVGHVYGTGDTYAPVDTQRSYARAAGLAVVLPVVDDYGLGTLAAPVVANQPFGELDSITAAQIQYAPDFGTDGHFVSTRNGNARRAIQKMLVTFARDANPVIEP